MNWNPNELYQRHDIAANYDAIRFTSMSGRVFNHWEQHVIKKCFKGVPKGKTLVDMPCGTGRLAEPLLAAGYSVHGMDISAEMLNVAERRLQPFGARFTSEVADARSLPDQPATFDAALCARILMHFPLAQQKTFLAAVARLSRGTVVINHCLDSPYQRFRRRVKRALGQQPSANYPVGNVQIRELLAHAGLREVKRYRLMPLISEAVYVIAVKV